MAKANFKLPNGTVVDVEGTSEEVERLLAFYGGAPAKHGQAAAMEVTQKSVNAGAVSEQESGVDLMEIVHFVKTADTFERIEAAVLDRTSVLNRVLLPLFVVHQHKGNALGLTSGEISKITTELGVPITQPNVSTCLSGNAKGYVIGDKMRVKGYPVRYRLNRRGVQYFQGVLAPQQQS